MMSAVAGVAPISRAMLPATADPTSLAQATNAKPRDTREDSPPAMLDLENGDPILLPMGPEEDPLVDLSWLKD